MEGAARSLSALLRGLIDYAGLFPPAALDMRAAVRRHHRHLAGPHREALGRFVVPASRLEELAQVAFDGGDGPRSSHEHSWSLSALIAPPFEDDLERVRLFNRRSSTGVPPVSTGTGTGVPPATWRARVEAVEAKDVRAGDLAGLARTARGLELYVEVPLSSDLLEALPPHGARAKIRMGGTTPEAFPAADAVAGWLARCSELRLAFKATAGLHHAIPGEYPVTYDADAPRAPMHGFLNMFLSAALLYCGRVNREESVALLEERDPRAFAFRDDEAAWRGRQVATSELRAVRAFALGFGSCSFNEPMEDLARLRLLSPAPIP